MKEEMRDSPQEGEEWEWLDRREREVSISSKSIYNFQVEKTERQELVRLLKKYGCPDCLGTIPPE